MENKDLERIRAVYPDATDGELEEARRRLDEYIEIVLDVAKYLELPNTRQEEKNT